MVPSGLDQRPGGRDNDSVSPVFPRGPGGMPFMAQTRGKPWQTVTRSTMSHVILATSQGDGQFPHREEPGARVKKVKVTQWNLLVRPQSVPNTRGTGLASLPSRLPRPRAKVFEGSWTRGI